MNLVDEGRGMLWGLLGVCVFSLTLPVTRYIVPWFDPFFIGMGRVALAGLVSIPILLMARQRLPDATQFKQLLSVAFGIALAFPVLSAWAMETVPAAHGGVVLGILPLVTALFGALVAHERPSVGFWLSAALGSLAVIAFVIHEQPTGDMGWRTADLALLLAVISAAYSYAVGGRLSREMGGWQVICWATVVALPLSLPMALWRLPDGATAIPLEGWLGFLYLALFSQLIGFFWWNKGLALGGIARVSQVQLTQTFITLAAASMMLGEQVTGATIAFAVVIVLLVAVGRRMPIKHQSEIN
ncbi:MAG: DMT family transporter [Gammaproteobacteria bacterium]